MKHWNWILPLSVTAGILIVIFCFVIPANENEREFEINKQLRDLKTTNELLKRDNFKLTIKIDKSKIEADSLKRLIQQDSKAIQTLKKTRNEKLDAISDFNDDELYRFFTEFAADSSANK